MGLLGLSLIGFTVLFLWCFADNHITRRELPVRSYFWGHQKFDSDAWLRLCPTNESVTGEQLDARGRMLFSLIRTHHLLGMSREEILKLLGNPDWIDEKGYRIGSHTGLRIDDDVFYLVFDGDGRVADFWVEQN